MPIEFACECGKRYRVKDQYSGRSIVCRACQASIMVPGAEAADLGIETGPASDGGSRRLDDLAEQLGQLRRSNSRLLVVAIVGPILAGIVGLAAPFFTRGPEAAPSRAAAPATPSPLSGVIEAKGLVIRDDKGRVRATLGYDGEKAVGLKLFEDGKLRTEHRVWDNGIPATIFYYFTGTEAASIGGGGTGTPTLDMYDIKGDQRVNLEVFDTGQPILTMSHQDVRTRFQLGVKSSGIPFFDFFDQKNRILPVLDEAGIPLVSRPADQ